MIYYDYTSEREKLKEFCENLGGVFEESRTEPKYKCIIYTTKNVPEMIKQLENIIDTNITKLNEIIRNSEFTIELKNVEREYDVSVSYTISREYTIKPNIYSNLKIEIRKSDQVSELNLREESISMIRKIKEILKKIIGVNNN